MVMKILPSTQLLWRKILLALLLMMISKMLNCIWMVQQFLLLLPLVVNMLPSIWLLLSLSPRITTRDLLLKAMLSMALTRLWNCSWTALLMLPLLVTTMVMLLRLLIVLLVKQSLSMPVVSLSKKSMLLMTRSARIQLMLNLVHSRLLLTVVRMLNFPSSV